MATETMGTVITTTAEGKGEQGHYEEGRAWRQGQRQTTATTTQPQNTNK